MNTNWKIIKNLIFVYDIYTFLYMWYIYIYVCIYNINRIERHLRVRLLLKYFWGFFCKLFTGGVGGGEVSKLYRKEHK